MRPVTVIGGARRRCAACLLPLAVVVVPPAVVLPVADVPPVARLPLALAKDEDVRSAARVCPTASEDVGSVEMDGGVVGATVVDGGSGGSSAEGLLLLVSGKIQPECYST
jgi:hypothetical protein